MRRGAYKEVVVKLTTGSFVALPFGSPIAVSGTFAADGTFVSLATREPQDIGNPADARYFSQRSIVHAVKSYGLRFDGGVVSAARIAGINDKGMTLAEAKAHPFLGATMPSIDVIVAAYSPDAVTVAA